ncbi:MAG TPA: penicillin-binding transpeptidase domain-containing protein, partial [Pyrinomonadaceae bacterium]|nr:penicillin-binding transpeptidase domain-containing protein [Pyrinomonadaceae bacterium]
LAFEQAFPPGSTVKPFTAYTGLRDKIIQRDTRLRCRGKYTRSEAIDSCSHPPRLGPFDPAEALAYSCNYYFAKVGEKVDEQNFAVVLSQFGFGQLTGVTDKESAGVLARGRWRPESALGEGDFLQVTPIQLAIAYAALFNGGRLFIPTTSTTALSTPLHAHLSINDDARSVLLEGMRGAVTFGTAAKAKLDSLPVYVVGKTGTSTQLGGFRSQGWFAGLAFPTNTETGPTDAQLVVIVFLRRAHGSEAAEVARGIFAEIGSSRRPDSESVSVSVHQVTENITQKLPLEAYLVRIVASEASVEDQPEALKALAVAARTYTLKNLGRHQQEGYDFCSTTHCQRFATTEIRAALAAAVSGTAGLV